MKDPKIISTTGLPRSRVFSFWRDALYEAGVGSDVKTPDLEGFAASQTQYDMGDVILNFWRAKAYQVEKTPGDVAQTRSRHYSLSFIREGGLVTRQSGREAIVNAGDATLRNADEPSFMRTPHFNALTLHIPNDMLERWLPAPQDVTAISLGKYSRWGGALTAALSALDPNTIDKLAISPTALAENICGLLALTLGPVKHIASDRQVSTLAHFRRLMRERFHEPDFSPAILAAEVGVSRRTLHYVFAQAESSFGGELKSMRLQRAREMLDDPRFDRKSIAEIATLVGFTHASHFTTLFKQAYGVAPLEYKSIRRL